MLQSDKRGGLKMANMQKYSKAEAGAILTHDERKATDKIKVRKNETIRAEDTHKNYNLVLTPHKNKSVEQYIKDYTNNNNINLNSRKDLNVMVSWVVTKPKEITPQEQERFFFECNRFLIDRYGHLGQNGNADNVLTSVVHLDEATPHLHFCFIPIAYDSKNHRHTVSAKAVCTRKDLQTFHKDLSTHMQQIFGRNIGIENGATKEGNQTIEQLKHKSDLDQQIRELSRKSVNLQNQVQIDKRRLKMLSDKAHDALRRSQIEASEIIRKATEDAQSVSEGIIKQAEEKAIKFVETSDFSIAEDWKTVRKFGNPFRPKEIAYIYAPLNYFEKMCEYANKHIDHTSELQEQEQNFKLKINILQSQIDELQDRQQENEIEIIKLNEKIFKSENNASLLSEQLEASQKYRIKLTNFLSEKNLISDYKNWENVQNDLKNPFYINSEDYDIAKQELIDVLNSNSIPTKSNDRIIAIPYRLKHQALQLINNFENLDLTSNRGLHR